MKKALMALAILAASTPCLAQDQYGQETFDQSQFGATPFEERGITRPGTPEEAYETRPNGELDVNTGMESYDYWPNGGEEADDSYETFDAEERDSWLEQDFGSGADDDYLDYDYMEEPYNPVSPYEDF